MGPAVGGGHCCDDQASTAGANDVSCECSVSVVMAHCCLVSWRTEVSAINRGPKAGLVKLGRMGLVSGTGEKASKSGVEFFQNGWHRRSAVPLSSLGLNAVAFINVC